MVVSHPNGQRAAWEYLCNTTAEDDALRIRQIEQDILNVESLETYEHPAYPKRITTVISTLFDSVH